MKIPETFKRRGEVLFSEGPGRREGQNRSRYKLCLTSARREPLAQLLFRLAEHPECYFVKFGWKSQGGIYWGRFLATTDQAIGSLWAELRSSEEIICAVQDDDFTLSYRGMKPEVQAKFRREWLQEEPPSTEPENSVSRD